MQRERSVDELRDDLLSMEWIANLGNGFEIKYRHDFTFDIISEGFDCKKWVVPVEWVKDKNDFSIINPYDDFLPLCPKTYIAFISLKAMGEL